jgi:hypothetical protein
MGHVRVVGVVGCEGVADAGFAFVGRQQPCRLGDAALAVHQLRLDGIEPGTLGRQQAGHDPHRAIPVGALAYWTADALVTKYLPSPGMLS